MLIMYKKWFAELLDSVSSGVQSDTCNEQSLLEMFRFVFYEGGLRENTGVPIFSRITVLIHSSTIRRLAGMCRPLS